MIRLALEGDLQWKKLAQTVKAKSDDMLTPSGESERNKPARDS